MLHSSRIYHSASELDMMREFLAIQQEARKSSQQEASFESKASEENYKAGTGPVKWTTACELD